MKQKKKKAIFSKHYDGDNATVLFSHLPTDLLPDDMIDIVREDQYVSESNSYDARTELFVLRMVEETDEEYQRRLDREATEEKWRKEQRYKNYLSLKKEFEATPEDQHSFTVEQVNQIALDVMNLGLTLRQNQLNGTDGRSGNDVIKEYLNNLK